LWGGSRFIVDLWVIPRLGCNSFKPCNSSIKLFFIFQQLLCHKIKHVIMKRVQLEKTSNWLPNDYEVIAWCRFYFCG